MCYWQELLAPDRRPYYYDHISHTWTFVKPRERRLEISQAVEPIGFAQEESESEIEEPPDLQSTRVPEEAPEQNVLPDSQDRETNHEVLNEDDFDVDVDIDERLRTVLGTVNGLSPQDEAEEQVDPEDICPRVEESIPRDDPLVCPYCSKQFLDEASKVQHLAAMSGRRWHPVVEWVDGGEQRWGAPVPFGLDAVKDVITVAAGEDTQKYYYNPKTNFVAWTKNEVIQANLILYPKLRRVPLSSQFEGPAGERAFWYHSSMNISAWDLEKLLLKCLDQGWRPEFEADNEASSSQTSSMII